jgi:predicted double-glycine peptidase
MVNSSMPGIYFYLLMTFVFVAVQGCAAYSITDADIEGTGPAVDVQYIAQLESFSCGAASLEMVSAYWGKTIRQEDIINTAGDRVREIGFSVGELKSIAAASGLKAVSFAGSDRILEKQLTRGRPVIVALSLPYNRTLKSPLMRKMPASIGAAYFMHNYSHFVVVVGITAAKIIVMDPLTGIDSYTRDEFEKRWRDRSRAALLITS